MSKEKIEIPDNFMAGPAWSMLAALAVLMIAVGGLFFVIGQSCGESWTRAEAVGDGYFKYNKRFYRVERIEGDVRLIDEVPYFVLPLEVGDADNADNQPDEESNEE